MKPTSGYLDGPAAALPMVEALHDEPDLAAYPYRAATHADLLRRIGDDRAAAACYEEALALTGNQVEADFLADRLAEVQRRD